MQNRWTDSAEGPRGLVQEIRHSLGSLVANNDVTQIAELGRLQRVLGTIEQRFAGRRAELMAMGTIQEVNGILAQTAELCRQAADQVASGAPLNLGPANDELDRALQALAGSPTPPATPKAVLDASRAFDEEASEIITRLRAQAQEIEAKTASMRAEAEAAVTTALGAVSAAQSQSDEAIGQNSQRLVELQGRVDTLIDNQQARFSEGLEQQRNEFGALTEDARAKLAESLRLSSDATRVQIEESKAAADSQLQESKASADGVLAALADMRKRAEDQLTVIGATGLAGGYKTSADRENRSRMWWRLVTVGFGLLAVAFLVWAAAHSSSGSASWIGVATKTAVAVAFGSLAAYAGRLAGRHHRRAAHYRDRELALASLGTYLESLDDSDRAALMAQLAPSFFCELQEDHTKDDWPAQTNSVLDQASQLITKLQAKP